MPPEKAVTQLLAEHRAGNPDALEQLIPLVYEELRRIAARQLRAERPGHTLQPTALVNEAYVRLVGDRDVAWQNRAHFFAVAAQVIRHVLVDYARARRSGKRGGGAERVDLDAALLRASERDLDVVALDDALKGLEALDPRKARLVELRFFAGLGIEETAEALGVSPMTVKRDWTMAKAWLRKELLRRGPGDRADD